MKTVVGFSKPKNNPIPIFSWLIRLFDNTEYSHVYIKWNSKLINGDIYYQANSSGSNFCSPGEFLSHNSPLEEYEISISQDTHVQLLRFCLLNSGKKYGVIQIIGISIAKLLNLKTNPLSKGRDLAVCSELVGVILEDILTLDVIDNLDLVTPKSINETLKSNSSFIRVL